MTLFGFSAFPPASTNFSLSERSQPQDQGTKAPCLLPDALGNTKLPYLSSISTVFSSTAILPSNSKTLRKPRSNLHFQQLNQAQCSKMYYKKIQTVIATSTLLATHYGTAASMTLKSGDSKIRCCPTGLEILSREPINSDGNSFQNKTENTHYLTRTSFLVSFHWTEISIMNTFWTLLL